MLFAHTVHGLTLCLGTLLPPAPLKPPNCLANLLSSFTYAWVCSEFSPVNLFLHISDTASPSVIF